MSTGGVHENEMPQRPTNQCPDEWPADDPVLASFAEDLRIIADGPAPEPRPGLMAVMRQGVVPIDSPAAGGRRKMLTKTVLGGLAAKVALGLGVATASVTAVGATGALPDPAQDVVASVVAAATPFQLPDPSGVTTLDTDEPGGSTTTTTSTTVAGGDDGEGTGGVGADGRTVNHGLCVSTAARDKSNDGDQNHGKTVSSIARSDCGKETPGSSTTSTTVAGSTTTSSTSSTSTTVATGQRSANSGPGNSGNGNSGNGTGNSGNGNGNSGSGSANSGPGNSGRT